MGGGGGVNNYNNNMWNHPGLIFRTICALSWTTTWTEEQYTGELEEQAKDFFLKNNF